MQHLLEPATNVQMRVDTRVFADDQMHRGNLSHYLSCGESALSVIRAATSLARVTPRTILDYGAGAGRVTRWLKAEYPNAKLSACDVRAADMEFLRTSFGIEAWRVDPDVATVAMPSCYDLIWVGSVVTHLPETSCKLLINRLFAACNAGGLLAISFHGRHVIERPDAATRYIPDEGLWRKVVSGYDTLGYGYVDYPNQTNYGISACRATWMAQLVQAIPQARLMLLSEHCWDNHHDVVVIQKLAPA